MSVFFKSFLIFTGVVLMGMQTPLFALNFKEKLIDIGADNNNLVVKIELIQAESKWKGSRVVTYWKARSLENSHQRAPQALIGSNQEFEFTSQGGIPNEAPTDPKLSGCGKELHNLCAQAVYGSGTEELFKMLAIGQTAYIVLENKSSQRTNFHLRGSVRILPISKDSAGEEVITSDLELNGQIQPFAATAPGSATQPTHSHDHSAKYKLNDFKPILQKAFDQ